MTYVVTCSDCGARIASGFGLQAKYVLPHDTCCPSHAATVVWTYNPEHAEWLSKLFTSGGDQ